MDLSGIKSQTAQQYVSLLSNPEFLKIVKSAANNGDSSRYAGLMSSLEKLNAILENSDDESTRNENVLKVIKPTEQANGNAPASKLDSSSLDEEISKRVDDVIKHADMMEEMLDLEMIDLPPNIADLFEKFREIITKLDKELRNISEKERAKKPKEKFLLQPSANSKSGFNESLSFLVQ